jgi:oligosaccharide reducing-end xylanase
MHLTKILPRAAFAILSLSLSAYSQTTPATAAGTTSAPATSPKLDDGAGAFVTGKYRNLFLEASHTEDQIQAKINAAYNQLLGPDPNKTFYFPAGSNANGPLAYVCAIYENDVRSEGMSYGMMLTVQMDKKADFDAIWNWSKTYMYHDNPAHPTYGYFSWQMRRDGTAMDEGPAPDGEEYFAMALYFAAHRWGNGKGIYDYKAAADRLLTDIVHRQPVAAAGGGGRGGRGGNMVNEQQAMIRFVPNSAFTDPSYHLPAFYELWARWGPEADRAFWLRAAQASRDLFQKTVHPKTGLSPAYCNWDGSPSGGARGQGAFRLDSWRTAGNWSVDWSWWAKDPRQHDFSDKLQAFFEAQGMDSYANQFTLDGTVLNVPRQAHSIGLVGMNAVASLAATDKDRAKKFVEALWNADIPTNPERYYDGALYLFSLLHCSGQFRIWPPK